MAAWKASDPRSLGGIFDVCHREEGRGRGVEGKRERDMHGKLNVLLSPLPLEFIVLLKREYEEE